MTTKQFDGVSFAKQNKKECVLLLRLDEMKTTRSGFPPKHKPTNTDLPPADIGSELLTIQAVVKGEDGISATTYEWVKRHQDKISKVKIKPEREQLEVTLLKTDGRDWLKPYIEYLLEL